MFFKNLLLEITRTLISGEFYRKYFMRKGRLTVMQFEYVAISILMDLIIKTA